MLGKPGALPSPSQQQAQGAHLSITNELPGGTISAADANTKYRSSPMGVLRHSSLGAEAVAAATKLGLWESFCPQG